jgi:uncharacterized protein (DUF433 family)
MDRSLSEPDYKFLLYSLRFARGEYSNARTSQLSGIPSSTLYEWSRNDIYVPDFVTDNPKAWSYRDLVYLRLLAWLRQGGMERHTACIQVRQLKNEIAGGATVWRLFADRNSLMVNDERVSRTSGQSILPFEDVSGLFRIFSIFEPIEELRNRLNVTWAPDLIRPSDYTFISPSVMAGDPCIVETRIPTSTIHALHEERGLGMAEIVELYPGITVESAEDAYRLELKLRGDEYPDSTAA